MNTKLILVEGLPGFGKSTTAKLINEILTENYSQTELFLEGNLDHPADYEGVSYFEKQEFEKLIEDSGDFTKVLLERAVNKGDHYLLPYRKIKNEYGSAFPDELLRTVIQNDIYELPLDKNMELIVDKWTDFAEKAAIEDKTFIFECCFIQNPLTIGLVKYGAPKDKVVNYVLRLAEMIERLHPILVYVEQDNLEASFRKAVKERPREWSSGFMDYYTSQGYGKEHGYEGLEGTLNVLEARKLLENEIVESVNMRKILMNNSRYEMEKYKALLVEKLNEVLPRGR